MRQQHQQIQENPRPEDALDERGSYDNSAAAAERADGVGPAAGDRTDRDGASAEDGDARRIDGAERPEFHEPAPLPTAFGATSVGGAVASSALAGDRRDPREEELARAGDGVTEDRIDGIDDNPGPTTTDNHPATVDQSGNGRTVRQEHDGTTAAFLEPETVQEFRDRWREVQLRFVDDPSGAAADAQRLVEESVEALTTALAERRAELGRWQGDGATGDAADTEQLRTVVRRHREFLDRILGR